MRNETSRFAVEQLEGRRLLSVAPYLFVSDSTAFEGNVGPRNALVTVRLSHASHKTVSVDFRTQDGTARAGGDYQAMSGTLKFAPGETRKTIAVPMYGDRVIEPNETFFVFITRARGANVADGIEGRGMVTIVDDDDLRVSIESAAAAEGNAGTTLFNFTVRLSAPADDPVTVNYATADDTATTAGGDYLGTSGTVTFAPGETATTITVAVLGDTTAEEHEGFRVILSGVSANASLSSEWAAYGSIQDDDGYYGEDDGGGGYYTDPWSYWPGYYWY